MVAHSGPGWQLAAALITLEQQANLLAPGRNKASDGSIGDESHANRNSAHNSKPFVHALDLTHSPETGFDARKFEDALAAACIAGERRIKGIGGYNTTTNSERWFACRNGFWSWIDQNLHGASHKTHVHVEVNELGDHDARPFDLSSLTHPTPPTPPATESEIDMLIIKVTDAAPGVFATTDGVYWKNANGAALAEMRRVGVKTISLSDAELRAAFIKAS